MNYLLHINVASGEDVYYMWDNPQDCQDGLIEYVKAWWDDEVNNDFRPDGKPLGDEVTLEDVRLYFELAGEYANVVVFDSDSFSGRVYAADAWWEFIK